MALPSSGQITLAQIRDEFGAGTTSNVSLRTLSAAAGLSAPDAFNEFYGLSAFTAPTPVFQGGTGMSYTGAGTVSNPYFVSFNTSSFSNDFVDVGDGNFIHQWIFAGYFKFTANTPGQYKVYMDVTNITASGFTSGDNNCQLLTAASRFTSVAYSIGANAPTSSAVLVVNAAEVSQTDTKVYSVGEVVHDQTWSSVVLNAGMDIDNVTIRYKFELI